jgi:hypothetical protein
MIMGRSLTPLNSSRALRAVRQRETVRRNDDNSRRKVHNVRGGSSDKLQRDLKTVESRYGEDVLQLVIASGYLSKACRQSRDQAVPRSAPPGNPDRIPRHHLGDFARSGE